MLETIKQYIPHPLVQLYRNWTEKRERKQYKGDKVTCPICGSSFSSFAPYKPSGRKNVRCINCRSLSRHRLLYLYMKNRTNLFDEEVNLRVLHLAPERQFYNILTKHKNLNYTFGDLYPDTHDFRGMKGIQQIDITSIPFPDNSFDVILANHILEHVPDDRKAMSELYRTMAPGGWGIFQVPLPPRREHTYEDPTITSPAARKKAFGQHDHVRIYGQDYIDRLKSAGFAVTPDAYAATFTKDDVIKFGINPGERIILCRKL